MTATKPETAVDCIYGEECPLHAENPPFNAVTLAAFEEAKAIMRGEIPANQQSASETEPAECPVCAAHRDPVTGNPRYNAETVAAIEEGIAISNGEIPAKRFHSLEEMLEDLDQRTGTHSDLF